MRHRDRLAQNLGQLSKVERFLIYLAAMSCFLIVRASTAPIFHFRYRPWRLALIYPFSFAFSIWISTGCFSEPNLITVWALSLGIALSFNQLIPG